MNKKLTVKSKINKLLPFKVKKLDAIKGGFNITLCDCKITEGATIATTTLLENTKVTNINCKHPF